MQILPFVGYFCVKKKMKKKGMKKFEAKPFYENLITILI
jgi:hypothetical protein